MANIGLIAPSISCDHTSMPSVFTISVRIVSTSLWRSAIQNLSCSNLFDPSLLALNSTFVCAAYVLALLLRGSKTSFACISSVNPDLAMQKPSQRVTTYSSLDPSLDSFPMVTLGYRRLLNRFSLYPRNSLFISWYLWCQSCIHLAIHFPSGGWFLMVLAHPGVMCNWGVSVLPRYTFYLLWIKHWDLTRFCF